MLVLTRKEGETTAIGDHVSVQGGQVRVGINPPRDIEVHREEVWQRINSPTAA